MTQVAYNTMPPPMTKVSEKKRKEKSKPKIKKRRKNWKPGKSLK